MPRSLIVAACLFGLPSAPAAGAGPAPPVKLASADLLADADVLRRVYEAAHPGLYRYNTRAQMDGHFAALRAEFGRDRTLAEAYLALSRFLATVRCGHTHANPFNQPDAVTAALFAGRNRVPFCFRWVAGRMVVSRDLSAERSLAPGTEVLAINGAKAPDILAKLMTVARADGANDAKRVASLEVRGVDRYEAFDIFLPLVYPATGEKFDLLVSAPGAEQPVTLTVAAHDELQRKALADGAARAAGAGPLWAFEALDDGSAYLRMPTWAVYDSDWDWRSFLDRGMDDLIARRVPALVIDLRGNEGGLAVGDALIARLTPREVPADGFRRYTRYRAMPAEFTPYLRTWDKSFRDWGASAADDRDGFFRLARPGDKAGAIAPRGKRYEGRVVVLTDGANSSATFQFAWVVQEHKLATLVGQATGGSRRGINGGAFFFLTLPKSRLEADLPLIATFAGDERPTGRAVPFLAVPDTGVEPDVRVTPTTDDIARGADPELDAAKRLLRAK